MNNLKLIKSEIISRNNELMICELNVENLKFEITIEDFIYNKKKIINQNDKIYKNEKSDKNE